MKNLFFAVVVSALFTSCGNVRNSGQDANPEAEVEVVDETAQLEYVPFKSSEDSLNWGLIGLDGTVLVNGGLPSEPSNVVGGMFIMRNNNGAWEYYTAEAEPKKVGGEYVKAGLFYEDVAPCVERGKNYIQFIRKDGTVAFDLKEFEGKDVEWVGRFHDGLAPFKAGKYIGYINTKGGVAIRPQFLKAGRFSDGYAVVVDTVGGNAVAFRDSSNYRVRVIDVEGNLLEHSFEALDSIGERFSEGLISCGVEPEDTLPRMYKFVDAQGNTIIPEEDDYRQLGNMSGNHFAFFTGRAWGIADNQASIILTPLYDEVIFMGGQSVVVLLYGKYKFLDYGGNQLSKSFDEVIYLENGTHFIGRRGEKWYVLDETGTIQGESCYKLSYNPGEDIIKR